MVNIMFLCFAVVLGVVDVLYTVRNEGRRVIYSILSVVSLLCCVSVIILKNIGVIYSLFALVIVAVMNMIAISDMRTRYIPDVFLIILNVMCMISSFFVPNGNFIASIIVAWIVTGMCFLIGKKIKSPMGTGDLFCISALIMSTNFSGMINFIFLSLFSCMIYGVCNVLIKKKGLKTEVPFAPFMLIGYLGMMIYI